MTVDVLPGAVLAALLFAALLRAASPIIFAAMAALLTDLAGVINVGIEGLMLVSALVGVLGSAFAPTWFPSAPVWMLPWIGAAMGLLAAIALALLLGLFHLQFGADLIIAGIGINMLAAGLTVFLMVSVSGDKGSTANLVSYTLPPVPVPGLEAWPALIPWLNGDAGAGHHVLIYAAVLSAAALSVLLFRTRFGLRIRAIGENPEAARAAGLPVKRLQYLALGGSGLLAGLGGLYLSMGYLSVFQADMTAGRGFLGLAAVFLGARRPLGTLAAALLFGASAVLAAQLGLLNIPSQVVLMLPPLITIVSLVIFNERRARRSHPRAPATPIHKP